MLSCGELKMEETMTKLLAGLGNEVFWASRDTLSTIWVAIVTTVMFMAAWPLIAHTVSPLALIFCSMFSAATILAFSNKSLGWSLLGLVVFYGTAWLGMRTMGPLDTFDPFSSSTLLFLFTTTLFFLIYSREYRWFRSILGIF